MATSKDNENCQHVQNDPHMCKLKHEKFHFDILWCYRVLNHIRAGVFCYHIGWGHTSVSPFFVVQTWHDSSLRQNLSKAVNVKSIMTLL